MAEVVDACGAFAGELTSQLGKLDCGCDVVDVGRVIAMVLGAILCGGGAVEAKASGERPGERGPPVPVLVAGGAGNVTGLELAGHRGSADVKPSGDFAGRPYGAVVLLLLVDGWRRLFDVVLAISPGRESSPIPCFTDLHLYIKL